MGFLFGITTGPVVVDFDAVEERMDHNEIEEEVGRAEPHNMRFLFGVATGPVIVDLDDVDDEERGKAKEECCRSQPPSYHQKQQLQEDILLSCPAKETGEGSSCKNKSCCGTNDNDENEDDMVCPVCLVEGDHRCYVSVGAPCDHRACLPCLRAWYGTSNDEQRNRCFKCRQELDDPGILLRILGLPNVVGPARNNIHSEDDEAAVLAASGYLADENDVDELTRDWFEQNAKHCPHCSVVIVKDGGCRKMKCICGHEFCWLCAPRSRPKLKRSFPRRVGTFIRSSSRPIRKGIRRTFHLHLLFRAYTLGEIYGGAHEGYRHQCTCFEEYFDDEDYEGFDEEEEDYFNDEYY